MSHLLDVGQGWLRLEQGEDGAVEGVEVVVLEVGADSEAALAQQRAHGQLDVAPRVRGGPEEHQPPALPGQPCAAPHDLQKDLATMHSAS